MILNPTASVPTPEIEWPRSKEELVTTISDRSDEIKCILSAHLRRGQDCVISDSASWLFGSFNVCIPVSIPDASAQRFALKFPLPYRFQGRHDLMDEKTRTEAGTFAWISQNCTRVPVPTLRGCGLSTGISFTPSQQLPWYRRTLLHLEKFWSWILRRPYNRPYIPFRRRDSLKSGYLLMDWVEEGFMLSCVYPPERSTHKHNLFKSLSRIMLDLAQPLDKIGSFTISDQGQMSLSNRPLTMALIDMDVLGIPTNVQKNRCYFETDAYLHDFLYCHDLRLLHKPGSMENVRDGEGQMAVLAAMRCLITQLTQRDLKPGPFVFQMTDYNTSNLLIDENFNITAIIDLEWFCSLPLEILSPPWWIGGRYVNDLLQDEDHPEGHATTLANIKNYERKCDHFLEIYEEEAQSQHSLPSSSFRANVMRTSLKRQTNWLWLALNNPEVVYNIFMEQFQPVFDPSQLLYPGLVHFQDTFAPYWSRCARQLAENKVREDKGQLHQTSPTS